LKVKYEEVYLKDYQTPEEAYRGLAGLALRAVENHLISG